MPSVLKVAVVGLVAASVLHLSQSLFGADEKAPFDRKNAKEGGLGMPTPYDKFLALDEQLKKGQVDWGTTARSLAKDIEPDEFKEKEVAIPMALGVRIADGAMAVKAKDAEHLNKCADDIEKLAKKLGVADDRLGRAREARTAANKGEWLKVFMELGFFQQDIMKELEDEKNATRGTLLIVTGWLQGARYTAGVIEENYSPAISNILREPMLVKALRDKVASLPAATRDSAAVGKISEVLPKIIEIIDIPTEGSISKENVAKIKALASEVVEVAVKAS